MKKITYIVLSLLGALLFSCSKGDLSNPQRGPVEVSFTAGLPLHSRASGDGALTNVDRNLYDLRFIAEIYDKKGICITRKVEIAAGGSEAVNFTFNLFHDEYDLLCWADFVTYAEQGANTADLFYQTNDGLRKVASLDAAKRTMNSDAKGAYCGTATLNLTAGSISVPNLTLKSPLAKVRVFSNEDVPQTNEVKIAYDVYYTSFDVANNSVGASSANETDPANVARSDGESRLVGFDYLFTDAVSDTRKLVITVRDGSGNTAEKTSGTTHLFPNKLTTITGNFTVTAP